MPADFKPKWKIASDPLKAMINLAVRQHFQQKAK